MNLASTSPLDYYVTAGKEAHRKNSEEHFDSLVSASGIDADANRAVAKKYRAQLDLIKGLDKKISLQKLFRGLLIALIVISPIAIICALTEGAHPLVSMILPPVAIVFMIAALLVIFLKINKTLKKIEAIKAEEQKKANAYLAEANAILAPLAALFKEEDIFRLIEKVMPDIKFEQRLSSELLSEMVSRFDFTDLAGERGSALETVSGKYTDNPFFFERYIQETMGTQTYTGSTVIHWTSTYRDSNGNTRTRHHTQTLVASVVKPKPFYRVHTKLHYGNQVAPDLSFSRAPTHCEKLDDKGFGKLVKEKEKELKKRESDALKEGKNFTAMANTEFDGVFGAFDRSHEQQYRVLFTVLAQTDMVKLMRSKDGFGDDFHFTKRGRHNIITSEHSANWEMNTHVSTFYSYDIDYFKSNFIRSSESFFKSVYFDFAPLLTIPAYQMDPVTSLDGLVDDKAFTHKDYEAVVNRIGREKFAHPDSATDVILKTEYIASFGDTDKVNVKALSYMGVPQIDVVMRLGGDGHMHPIHIHWVEYIPIEMTSTVDIKRVKDVSVEDFNKKRDVISELKGGGGVAFYHGLLACINSKDSVGVDEILSSITGKSEQ